jgi:hypothetical protein
LLWAIAVHASQLLAQHESIARPLIAPLGYFASHAATHPSALVAGADEDDDDEPDDPDGAGSAVSSLGGAEGWSVVLPSLPEQPEIHPEARKIPAPRTEAAFGERLLVTSDDDCNRCTPADRAKCEKSRLSDACARHLFGPSLGSMRTVDER